MMSRNFRGLAFYLALILFASQAGFAQVNTSAIAGVITDESGSVVPNATVTVTQAATGLTRKVTSANNGEYVVPQLPPGRYDAKVEASGFQAATATGITLDIAQRERLDFSLKVGAISQQVEVTAHAQITDTDTASLGQTIETRTIQDLPLNGRNYLTLGALSPGVTPQIPSSEGPASFVSSTTQRPDRSILVGGQRESSTSYLLDGVELRNPRVGDTSINPSLDAVQEFKIQRNFFEPEFGNAPGIINVATKAGTNQWHGTVYELLRNNTFDARNFFAATSEPFKRNQYGFSLGAPIVKDKLFIFGNYEGMRQRLGVVQRGLFPTQKELGGDFTGEATIYDPLTFDAATGIRQVFPGNVIPSNRINKVSQNFFPYIPKVNGPTIQGANLVGTPVQKLNDDQDTVRVDWLISPKNSLFGRQTWENSPLAPASLVPLGGTQVTSSGTNEVAQLTSTLTPTIVNVARAYHSYANLFGEQVTVSSNLAQAIGITGVSTTPANWGVPGVAWTGYTSIGSNGLTQGDKINNYELADSLSWIKGGHSLKFGAEVRQSRMFLDSDNGPRGSFTFAASWTAALNPSTGNPVTGTGQPIADFLLGYPTNMSGAVGTSQTHFRFYTNNFYAQDDWKVTRELTLNYGLRYEYVTPPVAEELNHVFGFDFKTGQQLFPVLGQIRDSIIKPDHLDFAPRLGLAYNPSWASSFVIRAGVGIYFDQTQMNEVQFTTNSPPTFFQQNLNYTGQGLPPAQFGVNALPVTPVPPITTSYQTPLGTNVFAEEIDGRKPREYMWNMSIQKSIGADWLAEIAYMGSSSVRLSKRYNTDAPVVPGVLYSVVPNSEPYPNLGGMLYSSQSGKGHFDALNLKLERRFNSGFSLLLAYSWSHSIDNDSGGSFGSPNLNPANFQLDKGSSDFDIRQRLAGSVLYELPFGKGKKFLGDAGSFINQLVGGWHLNVIPSFQSGVNRDVTAPNLSTISYVTMRAEATGINSGSSFTLNGATITPGQGFGSNNTSLYWFNPKAFAQTPPLQFGTSGRDILSAPGFVNWDISMFKYFRIRENMTLEFRGEFFDAFNNVRFDPPNLDSSSPFFGEILAAESPRIIQLVLRLQF
ncbi:MAG TPA: TonB-dependent receptor [Bryobacteraceae bacterium]|nr:TonB-dependent receptor [Bryobacteraceae bacterium]